MNKRKYTILIWILLFSFLLLSSFKIYHCPIKYIFGLSCPTCGITRAIICVVQLKFLESFYYYLFWPLILVIFIIYILYKLKKIFISKRHVMLILYIFCFLNLIYYFYRLFSGSSVVYFDFYESLLYKIISLCN